MEEKIRRNLLFIEISKLKIEEEQKRLADFIQEHPDYETNEYYNDVVRKMNEKIANLNSRMLFAVSDVTRDDIYEALLDEIMKDRYQSKGSER